MVSSVTVINLPSNSKGIGIGLQPPSLPTDGKKMRTLHEMQMRSAPFLT